MWGWKRRAWGDTDVSRTCLSSWYLENREGVRWEEVGGKETRETLKLNLLLICHCLLGRMLHPRTSPFS